MSPEFSICIPVLNDTHIKACLDSIFANKFQDFEVIVNDASEHFYVSEWISDYDVKIIRKKTKSFESRMISANASTGNRIIFFDDSRICQNTLLYRLSIMFQDMIVISERDIGKGILVKLSNLDKRGFSESRVKINPLKNKSVIPRVYKRDILIEALRSINANLTPVIVKNIVGLDLEIIYYQAFKISQNIGVISTPEILHYGDENLKSIFYKYYRYGLTQRMLTETIYNELANLSGRNRSSLYIRDRILSLPLQAIRGIPFILGYISGDYNATGDVFKK